MKVLRKSPVAITIIVIAIVALASLLLSIILYTNRTSVIKQEQPAEQFPTEPIAPFSAYNQFDIPFSDDFETDLSKWTITNNNTKNTVAIDTSVRFKNNASVKLSLNDRTNNSWIQLTKTFDSALTDVIFETYYYDSMATPGSAFQVRSNNQEVFISIGANTATGNNYYYRFDATTKNSGVPRSKGWHKFRIVVTKQGSFLSIDDKGMPEYHPMVKEAKSLELIATWDVNQHNWDAVSVKKLYTGPQAYTLYDSFETDLSQWNLLSGSSMFSSSTSNPHEYGRSLQITYTNDPYPHLQKALPSSLTNTLLRGYFYDPGPGKQAGVILQAKGATDAEKTIIGINSSRNASTYSYRHQDTWMDTQYPRSQGWHLFELIVTPNGTFTKVDNELMPQVNKAQKEIRYIEIIATWGLFNTYYIDDIQLLPINNLPWESQIIDHFKTFAEDYLFTDFGGSPYGSSSLYKNLNLMTHANDGRSIANTAISLYVYGKKYGDKTATRRGVQLAKDLLKYGDKPNLNPGGGWARGVAISNEVNLYLLVWNDLSVPEKLAVITIVRKQADQYLSAVSDTPSTTEWNYQWPVNGYGASDGDTKAEENGWHGHFLAQAYNYFPFLPNSTAYDKRAKCFAFHTITTGEINSYDPECKVYDYSGVGGNWTYRKNTTNQSQTVKVIDSNRWQLFNHGEASPAYGDSAIQELGYGAITYKNTGKSIPPEFKHNVTQLYEKFIKKEIEYASNPSYPINSYYFPFYYTKQPLQRDWEQVYMSFNHGAPFVLGYLDILGHAHGISRQDMLSVRSLLYYQNVGHYSDPVKTIHSYTQQMDPINTDTAWFKNGVYTAEILYQTLLARGDMQIAVVNDVCEEKLFYRKSWDMSGVDNTKWNGICDKSTYKAGSYSLSLYSDVITNTEVYGPLKPVEANKTYKITYWVKTQNVNQNTGDGTVSAKVFAAQYSSTAKEDDPIDSANRIDDGLNIGTNVYGTNEWKQVTTQFTTNAQTKYVRLRASLGSYSQGKVWFDSIQLIAL